MPLWSPADERERCELLLALGDAQNRAGAMDEAKGAFLAAADAARRLGAGANTADAAMLLARAALAFGGEGIAIGTLDWRQVELIEQALAMLDGASADAAESGPSLAGETVLRARLLARLALLLIWTPQWQRSRSLSEEAVGLARASGDPQALVAALHARRYVLWSPSRLAERVGLADEMIAVAERTGDAALILHSLR